MQQLGDAKVRIFIENLYEFKGTPLKKVWFLLLSTNLAREWLQIDTDLLHIITSIAKELSGGTISMTLNDLEPQKYGF